MWLGWERYLLASHSSIKGVYVLSSCPFAGNVPNRIFDLSLSVYDHSTRHYILKLKNRCAYVLCACGRHVVKGIPDNEIF